MSTGLSMLYYVQLTWTPNPPIPPPPARNHRRWLVQRVRDASRELTLTAEVLEDDAKNYHAWQHRAWVVDAFGLHAGEAAFTASLIGRDARNNSAWHHRWVALQLAAGGRTGGTPVGLAADVVAGEVAFVTAALHRAALNESAWSYLRALLDAAAPRSLLPELQLTMPPDSTTTPGLLLNLPATSSSIDVAADVCGGVLVAGSGVGGKCCWPRPVATLVGSIRAAAEPGVNVFANELLAEHVAACCVSRVGRGRVCAAASTSLLHDPATAAGDALSTAAASQLVGMLYSECAEAEPGRALYWKARAAGAAEVAVVSESRC